MKRILLTIEYDGTFYSGWQKQPNMRTIQGEIEEAIFKSTGEKVEVFGSGRTDAGVHAYNQTAPVPVEKLPYILNNVLPKDINIKSAKEVEENFHARFSIKKKIYLYKIYNNNQKNVFLANSAAWIKNPLDLTKMKEVALLLKGKHNFKGFCSANTSASDFEREIFDIEIERENDFVFVTISGSGFLYNMVRIIVGTMVDYSSGKITYEQIKKALEEGERSCAGQTMPACGLYLKETIY